MFDDAIRQANEHKAITSLRFLADLARSLGFENRKQESNAELIGRALCTLSGRKWQPRLTGPEGKQDA